jgi:hypothetical protein
LQCVGAKNATCSSPAQIQAVKKINQGPRNTFASMIQALRGTNWRTGNGWKHPEVGGNTPRL